MCIISSNFYIHITDNTSSNSGQYASDYYFLNYLPKIKFKGNIKIPSQGIENTDDDPCIKFVYKT